MCWSNISLSLYIYISICRLSNTSIHFSNRMAIIHWMCTWPSHPPTTHGTTLTAWHNTPREAPYNTRELRATSSRPMTLCPTCTLLALVPSSPTNTLQTQCDLYVNFFVLESCFFSPKRILSARGQAASIKILEILRFEERWSQNPSFFCLLRGLLTSRRRVLRLALKRSPGASCGWLASLEPIHYQYIGDVSVYRLRRPTALFVYFQMTETHP